MNTGLVDPPQTPRCICHCASTVCLCILLLDSSQVQRSDETVSPGGCDALGADMPASSLHDSLYCTSWVHLYLNLSSCRCSCFHQRHHYYYPRNGLGMVVRQPFRLNQTGRGIFRSAGSDGRPEQRSGESTIYSGLTSGEQPSYWIERSKNLLFAPGGSVDWNFSYSSECNDS